MKLQKISITNFRNLGQVNLELNNKINIFYGDNGSGKTSFLEAIYYLATGKSFRSSNAGALISSAAERLLVFAEVLQRDNPMNIGAERDQAGKTLLRMDRENVKSHLQISKLLPIQLFTAKDYRILEDGPEVRRQFLDWGLFHVEPSFLNYWQKMQKALKQRNAILKARMGNIGAQLKFWDEELITNGMQVNAMRQNYLKLLLPIVTEMLTNFLADYDIQLDYFAGWDLNKSFANVLTDALPEDLRFGYTNFGPHKADIQFKIGAQLVKNILSRGQQKLLVYALKIAQGILLQQMAQKSCLYLIDDLPSELDSLKQQKALAILNEIAAQMFITTVYKNSYPEVFHDSLVQLFHVEHGQIG